jgi:hypothetical protein
MAQAVSRWPLTGEALVGSKFSAFEIYGGRTFGFPLSVPFHQCSIVIFIYTLLLPEGQTSEAWEPAKKQCTSGNRGVLD